VPRKTKEDQFRRARYGNFSKAPNIIGIVIAYRDVYRASRDLEGFLKAAPERRVTSELRHLGVGPAELSPHPILASSARPLISVGLR
jgi:hypothetical protein